MAKTAYRITKAADKGDSLETLRELRHKIAMTLDECQSGRDIAALSRQLTLVVQQITDLENEYNTQDSVLSVIRAKHAAETVRISRSARQPAKEA